MTEHRVAAPAIVAPDAPYHNTTASVRSARTYTDIKRLLTVGAMLQARPRLAPVLRAAGYEVRTVERWDGLLDAVERQGVTATLVDLDAANQAAHSASGAPGRARLVSGTRLVSLLARRARAKRFALVVQTALDFVEIEELIRQGIHALIHPWLRDDAVAACIQHAIEQGIPAAPRPDLAPLDVAPWTNEDWATPGDATIPPAFG